MFVIKNTDPGLSTPHSCTEGVTMRQRRTLQYAAGRCRGVARTIRGEESPD